MWNCDVEILLETWGLLKGSGEFQTMFVKPLHVEFDYMGQCHQGVHLEAKYVLQMKL